MWQLPKLRKNLLKFCNKIYVGIRPPEWGVSGIVPIPKKGDLTITENYRVISLTQTVGKVYNRLLLNRIRPELEKILRPNQNGFRPLRSTSSQILAITIVRQRRLRLAGHVMRHDEAANKVLLWKPDGPRRRGRPTTPLQNILEKYTNLSGTNLIAAMKNRNLWKEIIISPH